MGPDRDRITERRQAEEALKAAYARLEEDDRRQNEFLAVLSHELRNPLAPIKNSLTILDRSTPGGDQARRAQAVIGRQVGPMGRLIDDLLDVSRVSQGKIQLQRERLELGERRIPVRSSPPRASMMVGGPGQPGVLSTVSMTIVDKPLCLGHDGQLLGETHAGL